MKRYVFTWSETRGGYNCADASAAGLPLILHSDHEAAMEELREKLSAAEAKAQSAEANDRRYRWLRDNQSRAALKRLNNTDSIAAMDIATDKYGDDWDAAIDSAIKAEEG